MCFVGKLLEVSTLAMIEVFYLEIVYFRFRKCGICRSVRHPSNILSESYVPLDLVEWLYFGCSELLLGGVFPLVQHFDGV